MFCDTNQFWHLFFRLILITLVSKVIIPSIPDWLNACRCCNDACNEELTCWKRPDFIIFLLAWILRYRFPVTDSIFCLVKGFLKNSRAFSHFSFWRCSGSPWLFFLSDIYCSSQYDEKILAFKRFMQCVIVSQSMFWIDSIGHVPVIENKAAVA